ncbi:unnamed protein product [Symbiodinium sp. CCMP2592]|nr:unnamed protein product [Symbiodinium sp. CCMP2592]
MSWSCLGLALALAFSVAALDSLEDANCPILGESFAAAGDDVGLHLLQLRGQNQSGNEGASSHDGCFHEVRKLMRFDAKLSLRQLQKIQFFTEAVLSSGSAERVLDSTTARRKLASDILEHTAANGTEAACGPTVSWLAELHLGIEGELLLKIPSVSTWPLWQTRADVLSSFAQRRGSKEETFWLKIDLGIPKTLPF